MLPLFSCLAGVVLGLHMNVIALLPVTLFGAMVFVMASWAFGTGPFADLGSLVILIVSVQAGYFLGLTGRVPYASLLSRFSPDASKRI